MKPVEWGVFSALSVGQNGEYFTKIMMQTGSGLLDEQCYTNTSFTHTDRNGFNSTHVHGRWKENNAYFKTLSK